MRALRSSLQNENIFGLGDIHDSRVRCVDPQRIESLDCALDIYLELLSFPDATAAELKPRGIRRQYGLNVFAGRTFADPVFDGVSLICVDQATTRAAFVRFLNNQHSHMEEISSKSSRDYNFLYQIDRDNRRPMYDFAPWFRLSREQFYWYNRTSKIKSIIEAYKALCIHADRLWELIDLRQLSGDPYSIWITHPSADGISRPFRLIDNKTVVIPADFDSRHFDPNAFAQKIVQTLPFVARLLPFSSSSSASSHSMSSVLCRLFEHYDKDH